MRTVAKVFWHCLAAMSVLAPAIVAGQSLNLEGQTGGVATPFATVASSPAGGIGRPVVSFYLADSLVDTGDLIGTRFQISLAAGVAGWAEMGYTRSAVNAGADPGFSNPFDRGLNSIHVKARFLDDRGAARPAPAIAVGVQYRWQLSDIQGGEPTNGADVYVVATKTLAASSSMAVLLSGGIKVTNSSLLGMAGNAPDWTARGFAAAAVVVAERVTIGGEVLQQPAAIEALPGADVPTTMSVFGRVSLIPDNVSLVVALVQGVGVDMPALDVKARHWLALGAAVGF
jgi:hypothetical protein